MNYQNGGWYDNPQTGKNQQYWNGQWFDTPQQGANNGSGPTSAYQDTVNEANNSLQNYINQQQGYGQNQFNNQQNIYNAENSQALGTQGAGDQQAFLSSVLNPDQVKQGSLEYGYNLGQNHENTTYGLNSTSNRQNRDLALNKLSNDENWANQNLNLQQGQTNAQTIDSLNSRGLLYGQKPTGAYQGESIDGVTGVAGQQAGLVNTGFANQRGQLTSDYNLNTQGVNQGFTQQQNMLDENHQYNSSENAFNAANGIQNQNNQYAFNTAQNNNQLAQYKAQLAQQQAQSQFQNKLSAQKLQGSNYQ